MIKQINQQVTAHSYHPLIEKHLHVSEESPFYSYYIKLIRAIVKVNEQAKTRIRLATDLLLES